LERGRDPVAAGDEGAARELEQPAAAEMPAPAGAVAVAASASKSGEHDSTIDTVSRQERITEEVKRKLDSQHLPEQKESVGAGADKKPQQGKTFLGRIFGKK
jgi:hypothetical protein